jgi:uncharacterized RDD family membrane protein YckC
VGGLIDAVLLIVVSGILIALMGPYALRLGPWGRLVGFAIGTIYLGLLNSRLGGGQTIGKVMAGTRVVGRDGRPIAVGRSFARAAILSFILTLSNVNPHIERRADRPYFGVGLEYNIHSIIPIPVFGSLLWALAIGGLFLIVYGYIVNARTRQGPHDLSLRTYVVEAKGVDGASAPRGITAHRNVAVGCAAIAALGGLLIGLGMASLMSVVMQYSDMEAFGTLLADERIADVTVTFRDETIDITIWARGFCYPPEERCPDLFEDVAQIITASPEAVGFSTIEVDVVHQAQFGWITWGEHRTQTWQIDNQ